MKRVWLGLRRFVNDLLDRSAKTKKYGLRIPDIWRTLIIILTGAASFIHLMKDVSLWGLPGSILPLVLLFFGVLWCIYVIGAKTEGTIESSLLHTTQDYGTHTTYTYGQSSRVLAKIGLGICLLLHGHSVLVRSKTKYDKVSPR